jgi:hypothetical protein
VERALGAQQFLARIFLLAAGVQFFLAGLAVFRAKPHGNDKLFESSSFDAHRVVGDFMILVAFALLVLAVVNRERLRIAALLFALMLIQYGLAYVGDSVAALGALHPLNGVLVLFVGHLLARRRKRAREEKRPPEKPPPEPAPA